MPFKEWINVQNVNLKWIIGFLISLLVSFTIIKPNSLEDIEFAIKIKRMLLELENIEKLTGESLNELKIFLDKTELDLERPDTAMRLGKQYTELISKDFFKANYLENIGIQDYKYFDDLIALRNKTLETGKLINQSANGRYSNSEREDIQTEVNPIQENLKFLINYNKQILIEYTEALPQIKFRICIYKIITIIELPFTLGILLLVLVGIVLLLLSNPKEKK